MRYKGAAGNPGKPTNGQTHIQKKIKVKTEGPIVEPPKQDRKQSIKNKNDRSLSFHFDLFSGCPFVRFSGCSLISPELLDKTYIIICAHRQNGLNEEIKIMCFICCFNGSRIKARQRSVARQIKSTLPGFYIDKLALIYTLTLTQTLNLTQSYTLTYTPACRAAIRCRASIRLPFQRSFLA